MKKLNEAVDRFAMRHPDFGVRGLIRYLVIGQAVVYFLTVFTRADAAFTIADLLSFNWYAILHGQIWRLVTYILVPDSQFMLGMIGQVIFFYFTYLIGTALEVDWGTAKFNLYYLSGVALTDIACLLGFLLGGRVSSATTAALNLSLFLAYAALHPDQEFLVMMILPVKAKWLAWIDAALYFWMVLQSLLALDFVGVLLPVVAVFNFVVFFWTEITDWIGYRQGVARHRTAPRTIRFKAAARQLRRKEAKQGYRHKCEICGRTDADNPDLEFRYCSRCAGYHCFCADHIFHHEHFRE